MTARARAVLSATVGVALAGWLFSPAYVAAEEPGFVRVDEVRTEPLSRTEPVIGRLVPRRSGVVAARRGGPVGEVRVSVGDRVAKGDVIAVLVSDSLRAQLDLRRAELRAAMLDYGRQRKLRRRRSAALSEARYDTAEQEVAKARANLRLAEIALEYATIRAPYDGVVTIRHTEIGSYLTAGQAVVTLVNDKAMEVEADVPANRIAGLTKGRVVDIAFADKGRYQAKVRAVVPQENPRTRTRAVRFEILTNGRAAAMASNESVTVYIPIGRPRQVLSVNKDAVISRGGKTLVFLVDRGQAKIRPVRLGVAVGSRFEVLSGLKPGDLVVVRGNERLRPGQRVRFNRGS